jgi:subtilisin family serine protease
MNYLDLVKLTPLMELTSGRHEITVGLIDGPVAIDHPDLASENIHGIPWRQADACTQAYSLACMHGTFVAGILCGKRNSPAPSICPNCTLLVRTIFKETTLGSGQMPSAAPGELARAIIDTIDAGAHVINLSVTLSNPLSKANGEPKIEEALEYASRRGIIIVAAAGNQGTIGSSIITRHPWVIPVVAVDLQGRPISQSNLGNSIGKRGLGAPGDNITSLGANGKPLTVSGTSVAAPFVTGTIALLWSEFPTATATELLLALKKVYALRQTTVVPSLLDAWGAYNHLKIGLKKLIL